MDGEKGGASGGNGIIIPREGGKQVGAADLSEANLSRRRSPSSESLSDMVGWSKQIFAERGKIRLKTPQIRRTTPRDEAYSRLRAKILIVRIAQCTVCRQPPSFGHPAAQFCSPQYSPFLTFGHRFFFYGLSNVSSSALTRIDANPS